MDVAQNGYINNSGVRQAALISHNQMNHTEPIAGIRDNQIRHNHGASGESSGLWIHCECTETRLMFDAVDQGGRRVGISSDDRVSKGG